MTLTDAQFDAIAAELNLTESTHTFIRAMRHGEPVRRVNRKINITGRFPSTKMGKTIQYESRSGEGLACLFYESDPDVLEFYDQPYTFRVRYQAPGSNKDYIEHTPDFLVIRRTTNVDGSSSHRITFEEWRESGRMSAFGQDDPKRWLHLLTGDWTQLPVEEHLRQLGLDYRIRLIDTTPQVLARNFELLADHFLHPQVLAAELVASIEHTVRARLGITFEALREEIPGATVDVLFAMLAQGKLGANLRTALLTEHGRVRLYRSAAMQALAEQRVAPVERGEVTIEAGAHVRLGSEEFVILSVGPETVYLVADRGGHGREVALADFTRWAHAGDIVAITGPSEDVSTLLAGSDDQLLVKTDARFRRIEPYLRSGACPTDRTERRWLAAYKRAEEVQGNGFLGLASNAPEQGNWVPRLAETTEEIAARTIKEQLLRPDQLSVRKAHGLYALACGEVTPPVHAMALSSFHYRYKLLSHAHRLRARTGGRAANAAAMRSGRGGLILPPHGDRAFARVHIDHTTLDVETRDSATGAGLGRPECTLVVDAFSRRILVALVLFQKPSAKTDMLALRELVRKYHQMPTTIVVDGGSDFTSKYFEALCSALKTKVEHRRTGNARDGGPVESAFKKLNTDLVWTLRGNTQIRKNVRAMGPEHDPSDRAIWTLPDLQAELDRYIAFHDEQVIPTLGGSPRTIFEKSMAAAGPRTFKAVAYTTAFRALTAQHTTRGSLATVGRDGVRVNNAQYWCEAFRLPGVEGSQVKVRFEPLDARVAYARIHKVWHVCHAEYPELAGKSEKQIAVASQELTRRLGSEPSMHELAVYLRDVQTREAGLTKEQHLRERRAGEQSAVVISRDTLNEEPQPEQPTSSTTTADTEAEPTATESELELTGYEQQSDEELRELVAEVMNEQEAA